MKGKILKPLLLVSFIMGTTTIFAQMYVSPNSYVFVNNEQVFITSDLELNAATSNFYLRNEAQLLQGTAAGGVNKGLGALSAYQEGTSNQYGYNYWCSPVGAPVAAAGNNTFGIGQLKRPSGVTTYGGESIVSTLDGSATNASLAISERWIYKFVNANQYSSWVYVGSGTTINPGEGFTMKGVSGSDNTAVLGVQNNPGNNQRYDFRGKPNDGTINITVGNIDGPNYENRTLTGNPYPSAINLNAFLLENSGFNINYATGVVSAGGPTNVINGNAYFWEHAKPATSHVLNQYVGGYGTYSPNGANIGTPGTYVPATWNTYNGDGTPNTTGGSTGSAYKRQFSPVGQGFKIQGIAAGTAQMKNIYRVFVKESIPTNSQFERNSNESSNHIASDNWDEIPNVAGTDYTQISKLPAPQIKIHTVLNNQFTREIALAFNPIAKDDLDNAFDGLAADASLPVDVYFPIVANKQYVISTLPFDIEKRMPIAFKANAPATFKITVGELVNFNLAENIYLHDMQTGVYHDIKNNFFEISLPAGNITDRFEITFQNATLGIGDNEAITSLEVYQDNTAHQLTIKNPKQTALKTCDVFDVTGKLIFSKKGLGSNEAYTFPTGNLSEGVYIVQLNTNDGQQIGKKVMITN